RLRLVVESLQHADLFVRRVGIAEVKTIIVVHDPVHPRPFAVVILVIGRGQVEVVDVRGPVAWAARLRIKAGRLHRNWIQVARRNLVVGENGPCVPTPTVRYRGEGIVNLHELTARVEEPGEISAELLRLRNRVGGAVKAGVTNALVGEHEEQSVLAVEDFGNPDRTFRQEAERITVALRYRQPEPVG